MCPAKAAKSEKSQDIMKLWFPFNVVLRLRYLGHILPQTRTGLVVIHFKGVWEGAKATTATKFSACQQTSYPSIDRLDTTKNDQSS